MPPGLVWATGGRTKRLKFWMGPPDFRASLCRRCSRDGRSDADAARDARDGIRYFILLLILAPLLLAQPLASPLEVGSAKPRPDLTARFTRDSGWTGADG